MIIKIDLFENEIYNFNNLILDKSSCKLNLLHIAIYYFLISIVLSMF